MRRLSRRAFLKWGTLFSTALAACRADPPEAPTLSLYNWDEYLKPDTIQAFQKATGILITQSTYGSNEELLARLQEAAPGTYDLIVPSDYMVRQLIDLGLLARLDSGRLGNLANVQAEFRLGREHDPEGLYSVTKNWGTTGLIWRDDLVTETPASWADLWALAPSYSGRVVVVEARDEVIGAALKLLGYSYNDNDPAHLQEAERKLLELRQHAGVLTDYFQPLSDGAVVMAVGWNGDAFLIREEYGASVQYAVPAEGSLLWEDNWCIPATALHPNNAHAFIDFVLQPAVAAAECEYLGYATVVEPALTLLDPAIRNDPSIFPPEAVRAKLERAAPLNDAAISRRQAIWEGFLKG